jgi:aminoglycoside phosphotransferase (APT) family kinase protein
VALGETDAIPMLLMTRLPGSLVWRPVDVDPYLRRLAAVLPGRTQPALTPSSRRTRLWRRAFEIFHGPAPSDERRFLHRDYHPGNVLWRAGTISGIVDWASARIGPPTSATAAWLSVAGRAEYDPYWDVVAVLGGCRQEDLACLDAADRALLQRAVAER